MTSDPDKPPTVPACERRPAPEQRRAWRFALLVVVLLLVPTSALLARLVWLPFYFGLLFFLVAGLLAGALSYRIARAARPISLQSLLGGLLFVAMVSIAVMVTWEYHHVAATVGDLPKFPDARNKAVRAGRSAGEVRQSAAHAFKAALDVDYPPGGVIGYVRWAVGGGEMELDVEGCKDVVGISHTGLGWLIRTFLGFLLLTAGLWASFESLRSATPVSNVLAPGEEYEEDE
ncbi:MAG: hypothetical protein ABII12_10765 [Planctomycetota bacterium]